MGIIIYQEKIRKFIYKVEESQIPPNVPYRVDCDEDSFLIEGEIDIDQLLLLEKPNFIKNKILLPVVTQDLDGNVLMQAFINQESLNLSFSTGFAHYFSRSRNRLWKKGEESGHLQSIKKIYYNIQYNFYVYEVNQNKYACHTGSYSCFYRKVENGKMFTI